MTHHTLNSTIAILCCLGATLPGAAMGETTGTTERDAYNVIWDAPSKNSSESMPCGGGDIGLNVWVENGEVLFYMQRSGSLAETNEYLKLGRVRLKLDPNPFAGSTTSFRQELKLQAGHVEIRGSADGKDGQPIDATLRIWIEHSRP